MVMSGAGTFPLRLASESLGFLGDSTEILRISQTFYGILSKLEDPEGILGGFFRDLEDFQGISKGFPRDFQGILSRCGGISKDLMGFFQSLKILKGFLGDSFEI